MNKNHSVHVKVDDDQFEYLSSKGNKSEYVRDLIKRDMQGGNDNTALLEMVRMALKQSDVLPVVESVMVVPGVQEMEPVELVKNNENLLSQFGWDE